MKIRFWGVRGSLATPGTSTAQYGGNTSCVQVTGAAGTVLVLDAGTGLLNLGAQLPKNLKRVDVLLSHLHMDHIQGLGFFSALYNPAMEVHLWGPASTTMNLRHRLGRYLSPPLFPVMFRDLPCSLYLHQVPCGDVEIGEFRVTSTAVCHPGPTVAYRISDGKSVIAYMPDHEPALGMRTWPNNSDWISGFSSAFRADVLIHDAQYTPEEYSARVGWGHSSYEQACLFAERAEVKHLVAFHHDPSHSDSVLTGLLQQAQTRINSVELSSALEGRVIELS